MNENRFGLDKKWLSAFAQVFQKYPEVQQVTIFGSRARGNNKPYSDIDLCLYGQPLDELIAMRIKDDLEDLYHPYFVDVVAFDTIGNPDLRQEIKKEEKRFYPL